jgi:acyl carrier protein
MNQELYAQVSDKIVEIVRIMLELSTDDAAKINRDSDLMSEVGFDSLRAFGMVTTIHEMLGVDFPDEVDPSSIQTINKISEYIISKYDESVISLMLSKSESEIREFVDDGDDFDDL